MNFLTLTVQHACSAAKSRPRISFSGQWLNEIGFVPGALVQALPEPDGMVFNLFNEDIKSHSELVRDTKEKGGGILHVYLTGAGKWKEPTFTTSGTYIFDGGLTFRDELVAKYDYGIIRARKIDAKKLGSETVKIIKLTRIKDKQTGQPTAKLRLSGEWLHDIGFIENLLVTAVSGAGFIIFTLRDGKLGYGELIKQVRKYKMKLIQIRTENIYPCISVTGSLVDRSGFTFDDAIAACYSNGVIQLQKLDFEKLGF